MPHYSDRLRDSRAIPHVIKHDDLLKALEPVCALLGVSPMDLYDETGLVITAESVKFTVAATRDDADRRPTRSADDVAEWVRDIEVFTDLGVTRAGV